MKNLRLFPILFSLLFVLAGCTKEEIPSPTADVPHDDAHDNATRVTESTSGLVKNPDGTWSSVRRVPLVGKGRMVDNYADALVSVLSSNTYLTNITDTDLSNAAAFGNGVLHADLLADELISVKDIHRTYAAGQKVGFVIKASESGLLTLDVLKKFWLHTYLDDTSVESSADQSSTGGGLLKLELVSIANNDGLQEVSFTTTQPFDEVALSVGGVSASVLQKMSILYAFVGENPMKYAYTGSVDYENAQLVDKTSWTGGAIFNPERIVDNDLTNYAIFEGLTGLLPGLFISPRVAVDFGCEVAAGTEVGFEVESTDILSIDLLKGGVKLATYSAVNNDSRLEFVDGASVVGISALSGGRSRINMKTTKPYRIAYLQFGNPGIQVRLGATKIFYAYTRDEVTLDESSFFSMPDKMSISHNSLLLPTPTRGTVRWRISRQEEGSSPEIETVNGCTRLKGLSKNGEYELVGIYTSDEGRSITTSTVITRNAIEPSARCNQLIGSKYGAYTTMGHGLDGGLVQILVNGKDSGNIIDNDPDTYARYGEGISVAKNLCIAAIGLKSPISPQETGNRRIRAGFTLQTTFDFLSADLLNFFVVKLYNGDRLVASSYHGGSDSQSQDFNTLGVSLIGTKSDKFRVYVETEEAFDHLELWSAGVLKLGLAERRIYNAFWESADEGVVCPSSAIQDAGLELLTATENNAHIDYTDTYPNRGVVGVAPRFVDLNRYIDPSKKTHALMHATSVGGISRLTVRFDEIPAPAQSSPATPPAPGETPVAAHHTVGVLLSKPDGWKDITDVALLEGQILEIMHGDRVVKKHDIVNVADLHLVGSSGDVYIETDVEEAFDGVRYSFAGVLGLTQIPLFSGVYARLDLDGDGIPDGSEGDVTPPDPIRPEERLKAVVTPSHICQNGELVITLTQGADPHKEYNIICSNIKDNYRETGYYNLRLSADNTFTLKTLPVGVFDIEVSDADNLHNHTDKLRATVHPLRTTWKGDAHNSDWNNWDNWTDGSPWRCTDVVIPTRCHLYPELDATAENYCANLHIAHHGEVVGTQNLDYSGRVWVDLSMPSGYYFLLSAPLKQMVTGDMFIPSKWQGDHSGERLFSRLNAITSPENRFSPRVYQRFWSCEVDGKVITDGTLHDRVVCSTTDWTAPFNAVAEPYRAGVGFMVRSEKESLGRPMMTFRFPKLHDEYTYYDASGASTGLVESISRTTGVGHFIFEGESSGSGHDWRYEVTVENALPDGRVFVAGNPLMCHIDIARFLAANSAVISEVKLFNGNGIYTTKSDRGEVMASSPSFTHIAPMQGFYVVARTPSKRLTLCFDADMQAQRPGYNISSVLAAPASRTMSAADRPMSPAHNTLQIEARCEGLGTLCMVRHNAAAHNGYDTEEDARLLYDREAAPTVAVFTVSDGQALEINQISSAEEIALGLLLRREGRVQLTLTHSGSDIWSRWVVEDRLEGRRYPLSQAQTHIDLGRSRSCTGRYFLVREK